MAKKMTDTMLATVANSAAKSILSAMKKLAMYNVEEVRRLEREVKFYEDNFKEATGHDICEFVDFEYTVNESVSEKTGRIQRRNTAVMSWREDAPVQPNRKVTKTDDNESVNENADNE